MALWRERDREREMLAHCQQGLCQGRGKGEGEWAATHTDDNLTIKQLYAAFYEHRPRAVSRVVWAYFLWGNLAGSLNI